MAVTLRASSNYDRLFFDLPGTSIRIIRLGQAVWFRVEEGRVITSLFMRPSGDSCVVSKPEHPSITNSPLERKEVLIDKLRLNQLEVGLRMAISKVDKVMPSWVCPLLEKVETRLLPQAKEPQKLRFQWMAWKSTMLRRLRKGDLSGTANVLACSLVFDSPEDLRGARHMFTSSELTEHHKELWELMEPDIPINVKDEMRGRLRIWGWNI